MVMAKTQIRSTHRVGERAAREEDRAAQRLHRALRAPARAPARCTSRRKEVERLQTTELARSNIQRPVHQVRDEAAVGHGWRSSATGVVEGVRRHAGRLGLQRHRQPRREDRARRPQRRRQDDAAQGAAGGRAGPAAVAGRHRRAARSAGATRCRSATSRRITPARSRRA